MESFINLNPLEQFEIIQIVPFYFLGINLAFTNFNLILFFLFSLIFLGIKIIFFNSRLFHSIRYFELFFNLFYKFLIRLLSENLGNFYGRAYRPITFTLFIYLLLLNLFGMVPYVFTVTSHIIVTFSLALSLFLGINIIAIRLNKLNFLSLFLPKGVPVIIVPLLIIIELISYIVKVFTLAIRLFTNRTSGHTLLKIIASFTWSRILSGSFLQIVAILPRRLLFILIILECGIALLQAYVFTLLIIIYLNDVITRH
jgi:ATP synthase subunit 6